VRHGTEDGRQGTKTRGTGQRTGDKEKNWIQATKDVRQGTEEGVTGEKYGKNAHAD
jgi:hypothetical protein